MQKFKSKFVVSVAPKKRQICRSWRGEQYIFSKLEILSVSVVQNTPNFELRFAVS
jgi:hypothetical protein